MNTQRVKVEKAEYDAESDTVAWQVTLTNGKKADLVWRREDFGPTFKIDALIPVSLVKEFCSNMEGKEINLVIEPKPEIPQTEDLKYTYRTNGD